MAKDNKKIRVLEVVSGLSPEGIGTFVLNVFENIDKDKVEISFALATEYKQFYEERLLKQGAKIYRTYEIGDGLTGKLKHFINIIKIIKKEGPFDVVHSHMDFFNGINLFAAFIARVPLRISHAHIEMDRKYLSTSKKIYNSIMRFFIRIFSNKKVGCSQNANLYINGVFENSIVVNNGINLDKFRGIYGLKKHVDVNIDSNKINFITIGRIEEQKNPVFIVEIINELKKLNSNIHLYWVGVGTLENRIKEMIKEYNLDEYITLLGKRSDIPDLLSNMNFMLFPSKWEGLGIVLIEAQSAGVPCFISNTIPKEANLGLCTVLDLDRNAKEWSNKINMYIREKSYNNKVNEEVLNLYNIKNVVKKLEKIYSKQESM